LQSTAENMTQSSSLWIYSLQTT